MRTVRTIALHATAFLTFLLAATAVEAQVVECSPEQRLLPVMPADETAEHRRTPLPSVAYPPGAKRGAWKFPLTLRVSAAGVVECYEQKSTENHEDVVKGLDAPRRAVVDGLAEWRYAPFMRGGKAVSVIVQETLREEWQPRRRSAPPEVPMDRVRISLERSECFGTCPSYFVEVRGDGRAVYEGRSHVAVLGRHEYRVDPARVAELIERIRSANLWSMEQRYAAAVSDNPATTVWMAFGKQEREIIDYVGESVGMPTAITGFQDLVDDVARTQQWTHLSIEAVDALKAEGFAFASAAGGELLARGVHGEAIGDDAALARLVELGAPIAGHSAKRASRETDDDAPLVQGALVAVRPLLVDALIARGALETNGRPDQRKIDAAFRSAIRGGDAALIEKIWKIPGDSPHPSQTFEDSAGDGFDDSAPKVRKTADVILLLDGAYTHPRKRLLAPAQFLESKGSQLGATRASGTTLLHIAAQANDLDFVQYLLAQRLDPSAVDSDGISALGTTYDENVAMVLLEGGTDPAVISSRNYSYRAFARMNGWYRVLAWLDAHGE